MGSSVSSSGRTAAESMWVDCTAASTRSCHPRNNARASSVSRRRIDRNHASDVELTNHKSMCGWIDNRACSSTGPWHAAIMPNAPPEARSGKPVGEDWGLQLTIVAKVAVERARAEHVLAEEPHGQYEITRLCNGVLGHNL